jgi:excisionase family DNA binding protein
MTEPLLTTKQAATYLAVSKAFLERDRWAGATIPFVRVGARAVRYRKKELDAFIEKRLTASSQHEETRHD